MKTLHALPHNNLPVECNFSHLKKVSKRGKRLSAANESNINMHLQNEVFASRIKRVKSPPWGRIGLRSGSVLTLNPPGPRPA